MRYCEWQKALLRCNPDPCRRQVAGLLLPPFDSSASRSFSLKEMSKSRGSVHHATCLLYLNHFWVNWGLTCRNSKKKKRRGIDNTQGLWGLGDRGAECRIGQGE